MFDWLKKLFTLTGRGTDLLPALALALGPEDRHEFDFEDEDNDSLWDLY
jgi:hypothetical protein